MQMKYWRSLDSHFTALLSNDALVYSVENRIDPVRNIKHWFVIRKLEIVSTVPYVMPRQKKSWHFKSENKINTPIKQKY